MQLKGKTALITGGSTGIGLGFAKALVQQGAQVLITGRNEERLQHAKQSVPEVHTFKSDVSDPNEIQSLFEATTSRFPDLNLLINNAGVFISRDLAQPPQEDEIDSEVDINLKGPLRMNKTFLPHLLKQPEAAIVTVSSALAYVPLPIGPIYCATKAAMHSYTRSLRVHLEETSTKVFEILPPAIETKMTEEFDDPNFKKLSVETLSAALTNGLKNNEFEILPGQARQLRFMSRFFPSFIFGQLAKASKMMIKELRSQPQN